MSTIFSSSIALFSEEPPCMVSVFVLCLSTKSYLLVSFHQQNLGERTKCSYNKKYERIKQVIFAFVQYCPSLFRELFEAHDSFVEEHYLSRKNHPPNSVCRVGETLFSLQRASHNSRVNHQQQSWSQIREL